jgi:hypothetical protein
MLRVLRAFRNIGNVWHCRQTQVADWSPSSYSRHADRYGREPMCCFPGLVVNEENTSVFRIAQAPDKHTGKGRVLVNYERRDGAKRYEIVRITTPRGRSAYAAAIGHYRPADVIMMDHDLRVALNLNAGDVTALEITRCGLPGTIWWYLSTRDPLIRVPAFLAVISVALGALSIVLAFK